MKFGRKYLSLHAAIVWFVCIVLILAFGVTGFLISEEVADQTRKDLSEKTLNVARMVGHSPIVIKGLQFKEEEDALQQFAEKIRELTNVRFIVVIDMQGIRKSHPDSWKIGEHFVGGDEKRALEGEEYISIAEGTLGNSLRAFEPIYSFEGEQIGAVSVGILLNKVNSVVKKSQRIIYVGIGLGIVVGIIGALFLANRVKRILFGLEPYEIAGILQERSAMIESVREGIVAVNQDREIVIANAEAVRMFEKAGIHGNPVGLTIEEYMPFSRLANVLVNGKKEFDQERNIEGVTFVVNRVPVKVDGQIVGAIATFRDKTELKHLAEQLTGVKLYAEALRVKSHEFMNKLHVILGMVHIGEYKKLTSYIHQLTENHQLEIDTISRFIKDPILAGFLLSKMSYAREQGVTLNVQGDSVLPEPNSPATMDEIITVIGNLIDNSIEAVQEFSNKNIDVLIDYDGEFLFFDVVDHKGGIPVEIRDEIFNKGFSTKGENRGYGLFLVRKTAKNLGGDIELFTNDEYTMFSVEIPYKSKEESA
ncbi:DcuS/MalK family sensor histidine kinase [Halobacillus shinanisalinarum]|uniref:DcuS/MalK family sensor histidine kinase n=1 Tax=Halobacillus shinanisalinarum TaxID=2932258 RepID=A0ABY4H397_9BACI|nr:DcuS/MalK family sensor histidine kinase [Halobacillus shinanisalinarum]UOQ94898.1 DcuS/MalK family sensor histidine kinase [Halobacillus shinanisalinarum]